MPPTPTLLATSFVIAALQPVVSDTPERKREMTSRYRPLRLLGTALLAFALSCYAAATNPPLVLGSYAYPGLERVAAIKPLARLVAKETGQRVEIKLYDDPGRLADGIRAGEVDIAVANLGAWLSIAGDPAVQPLAVVMPPALVQSSYRAVLLARHDLPITHLAEIGAQASGLRLAAVMPGSASGGLVQNTAVTQANTAAPKWRSVSFFGSHEGAMAALANDMADLAAVAQAPWLAWKAAQEGQAGSQKAPRVLWQSPPLPSGTLACRASPRLNCSALSASIIRHTSETRRAALYLGRGWPEWAGARRFAPYDHTLYSGLGIIGAVPQAAR
jgi:ABC-type phosphate/phosphonate transport system substrate-binding protein